MVAALLALALAAPAADTSSAPPSPPATAAAPPAAKPADDPLICRSETPIGTKLPVKTCIRKSERDRQKRESQDALQLIQRRSDGPTKERM